MLRSLRAPLLACALVLVLVPAAGAAPAYDANTVIVQYADGASSSATSALSKRAGVLAKVSNIYGTSAQVVRVAGNAGAVAAELNRSSLVNYAETNKILRATATPNDPSFPSMYGLAKISAPAGWDAAGLGAFPASGGAKVGIVDTGILSTHEDLTGKTANCAQSQGLIILAGSIEEGSCTDDNGHGSHVAGTITANTNNAKGVAGVSFNSPLAICKALNAVGSGSTSDVANCIRWAKDKGAKVISMSLGGGTSTTLQSAVTYAWSGGNGALLIAAAGNDGDATLNYPAAYAEVVSVAATDANDARASFSNANADVEIAAPGVNIISTWNDGAYNTISGTSMATPHVAGVAAVIAGENPGFNAAALRSKLTASVDDLGAAGRDTAFGFGRTNLLKAAS